MEPKIHIINTGPVGGTIGISDLTATITYGEGVNAADATFRLTLKLPLPRSSKHVRDELRRLGNSLSKAADSPSGMSSEFDE